MSLKNRLRTAFTIAVAVAAVLTHGRASAQSTLTGVTPAAVTIAGGMRLAWDQQLVSPEQSQQYYGRLWIDGKPGLFSETHCDPTSTATVITCWGVLPAMANGSHALQVSGFAGGVEGERSEALAGLSLTVAASGNELATRTGGADADVPCADSGSACFATDVLTTLASELSSLTPAPDGRLLFVEGGHHVRVLAGNALLPSPALTVDRATDRIIAVNLDAGYAETRIVFVAWIEEPVAGERTLSVARYRDVGDRLGQRVIVLSGVPLPTRADPRVAFDAANHIYVAVPSAQGSAFGRDYAGTVLRFSADGTVPWQSGQASPVLLDSYDRPTAITSSAVTHSVWLAGLGTSGDVELRLIPWSAQGARTVRVDAGWPNNGASGGSRAAGAEIVSATTSGSAPARIHLLDASGRLLRAVLNADGSLVAPDAPPLDLGGTPAAIVGTADGSLYVVVKLEATGRPLNRIFRLRPRT